MTESTRKQRMDQTMTNNQELPISPEIEDSTKDSEKDSDIPSFYDEDLGIRVVRVPNVPKLYKAR